MHTFYPTDGQIAHKNACILSYGWSNRVQKCMRFILRMVKKTYKNACILSYGWLNREKMHAFCPTDGQKHIKLNQPILQMVKKCKNAYVLPTGEELVCKNTCILP